MAPKGAFFCGVIELIQFGYISYRSLVCTGYYFGIDFKY